VKTAFTMYDARLLARIIHLAHRFGCTYTRIEAQASSGVYTATIELDGPSVPLRRLSAQIQKLLTIDKETM
jgi:hypothetical protein